MTGSRKLLIGKERLREYNSDDEELERTGSVSTVSDYEKAVSHQTSANTTKREPPLNVSQKALSETHDDSDEAEESQDSDETSDRDDAKNGNISNSEASYDSDESVFFPPPDAPPNAKPMSRSKRDACWKASENLHKARDELIKEHHWLFPIRGYHEIKQVRLDIKKYALAKDKSKIPALDAQIAKLEENKDRIEVLKWNRTFGPKEGQAFRRNDANERKLQSAMMVHHIKLAKAISKLPRLEKLIIVDIRPKIENDHEGFIADFDCHCTNNGRAFFNQLDDSIPQNPNVKRFVFETNWIEWWTLALSERVAPKYGTGVGKVYENLKRLDEKFPNVDAIKFKVCGHGSDPDFAVPFCQMKKTRLLILLFEMEGTHAGSLAYERYRANDRLERIFNFDQYWAALDSVDYSS